MIFGGVDVRIVKAYATEYGPVYLDADGWQYRGREYRKRYDHLESAKVGSSGWRLLPDGTFKSSQPASISIFDRAGAFVERAADASSGSARVLVAVAAIAAVAFLLSRR